MSPEPAARPDDAPEPEAPGLGEQLGNTRSAAAGLVRAHISLGQAELTSILDEAKRIGALGAVALAFAMLAGLLFPIGGFLLLGEWLFGSLGWGAAHGTLFLLDIAVVLIAVGMRIPGADLVRAFAVALVIGIALAIVLALNPTNALWTWVGDQLLPGIDIEAGSRALVAAVLIAGGVLAVLGAIGGAAAGGSKLRGLLGGLVAGALLGVVLGALSAVRYSVEVALALGLTVTFIAWLPLTGWAIAGRFDAEDMKARFWPSVTIDTAKETLEWLKSRLPIGQPSDPTS